MILSPSTSHSPIRYRDTIFRWPDTLHCYHPVFILWRQSKDGLAVSELCACLGSWKAVSLCLITIPCSSLLFNQSRDGNQRRKWGPITSDYCSNNASRRVMNWTYVHFVTHHAPLRTSTKTNFPCQKVKKFRTEPNMRELSCRSRITHPRELLPSELWP